MAKIIQADTMIYTQEAKNVEIKYNDSGFLKALIKAKTLVGYKREGQNIVRMPNGIMAYFYNRDGEQESFLTAEKGISYQDQKIIEVTQNVEVVNAEGEKLNTEKLVWDQKTEKIHTDKFVRITTATEVLTGIGMEARQDFSQWTILKPRGQISVQSDTSQQTP